MTQSDDISGSLYQTGSFYHDKTQKMQRLLPKTTKFSLGTDYAGLLV
jgi:hypothetical protein